MPSHCVTPSNSAWNFGKFESTVCFELYWFYHIYIFWSRGMYNVLIVEKKRTLYFPIAIPKHVRVKSGYFWTVLCQNIGFKYCSLNCWIKLYEKWFSKFWFGVMTKFPMISATDWNIIQPFYTTYLNKAAILALVIIKSKYWPSPKKC